MTPAEALAVIRRFGTVEAAGGALKIRAPRGQLAELGSALEVLRAAKTEVLAVLASTPCETQPQPPAEPEPSDEELSRATALMNTIGCRIVRLENGHAIGIWSDLDSAAIRSALQILELGELPVVYLDSPGVPLPYKIRLAAGTPVPEQVRVEMERHSAPWMVREWMFGKGWRSWAEWKANMLNQLFLEQGVAGQPGRITAETIRRAKWKAGGTT